MAAVTPSQVLKLNSFPKEAGASSLGRVAYEQCSSDKNDSLANGAKNSKKVVSYGDIKRDAGQDSEMLQKMLKGKGLTPEEIKKLGSEEYKRYLGTIDTTGANTSITRQQLERERAFFLNKSF
jgi:hypothetical protein